MGRDRLAIGAAQLETTLEIGDGGAGEVDTVELEHVVHPARREDVDLENLAARDVEADQVETVGDEARADGFAQLAFDLVQAAAAPRGARSTED